ncbi:MAG TPA: putative cytokinetic ring protein SteA [Actinomycetota bacterium]|nr:putative cytokinetic ring protein SteA [Actinomycetota bacterium]
MAQRLGRRRTRGGVQTARVDRRTKTLLRRVQPGEVAVIDHEDLDRVAAEELVTKGVSAVVNAARSISGRYPNLGPLIVVEAGIPLVDTVGTLLLAKVHEGDAVRLDGDRVYVRDDLVGVGIRQSPESVLAEMDAARQRLADQFESFAQNTLEFMARERDLMFGGLGLPELAHDMSGRHVLVVVRGYSFKEDLAALRPYIREVRPVVIGVDGGADALLEEGYRPDVILGDMDSVTERALGCGAEIVLHAFPNGFAPGRERLVALGLPFIAFEVSGTSEDAAFLLAHGKGADLIVAVGSHGNLREFLDKGRMGMASTFLVRLRVGEILVDAKGVSRLYRGALRGRDALLLVAAALVAVVVVVAVSPPLRLEVKLLWESFRQFVFHVRHGL